LMTSHAIKIGLQGTGGFAGDVALTATAVDAAGTAIPGWTVTLSAASVTLAANGAAEATATLTIPSASTALAGTIKLAATSTAATVNLTSAVTALKQVTFNVAQIGAAAAATCAYPPEFGTVAAPVVVLLGTKVRMVNKGAEVMTIHGNAPIPHQVGTIALDAAYEPNITTVGATRWWCHSLSSNPERGKPDPGAMGPHLTIMAP
jgi:hypothetical protein